MSPEAAEGLELRLRAHAELRTRCNEKSDCAQRCARRWRCYPGIASLAVQSRCQFVLIEVLQLVFCPPFFDSRLVKQNLDRDWLRKAAEEAKKEMQADPDQQPHKWSVDDIRVTAGLIIGALVQMLGPPCKAQHSD